MQNVHCIAIHKLRHWILISLLDMSVGYENKVRMYLNLTSVANSADSGQECVFD